MEMNNVKVKKCQNRNKPQEWTLMQEERKKEDLKKERKNERKKIFSMGMNNITVKKRQNENI